MVIIMIKWFIIIDYLLGHAQGAGTLLHGGQRRQGHKKLDFIFYSFLISVVTLNNI